MPKEARDLLESQKKAVNTDTVTDNAAKKKIFSAEDCDLVLPVIFEAVVDVTLQGQQVTLKLRSPGTIAGKFVIIAVLSCIRKLFFIHLPSHYFPI